jgi:hypothetical protein
LPADDDGPTALDAMTVALLEHEVQEHYALCRAEPDAERRHAMGRAFHDRVYYEPDSRKHWVLRAAIDGFAAETKQALATAEGDRARIRGRMVTLAQRWPELLKPAPVSDRPTRGVQQSRRRGAGRPRGRRVARRRACTARDDGDPGEPDDAPPARGAS